MEQPRKPIYKYCLVPMCKNTNKSAPDKRFFFIPRDAKIRKRWCKVMRREQISRVTCMYCCEDHFDIVEDTVNYFQYNIFKQKGIDIKLRLKKGVVPHIFQCQTGKQRSPPERMGAIKREKHPLTKTLSNPAYKGDVKETRKAPQMNKAGPSTSSLPDPNTSTLEPTYYLVGPSTSSYILVYNNEDEQEDTPLNIAQISPLKRKMFPENSVDATSTSCPSVLSTDYEPDEFSSGSSWIQDDAFASEHSKSVFLNSMILALEQEPEMLLGLP